MTPNSQHRSSLSAYSTLPSSRRPMAKHSTRWDVGAQYLRMILARWYDIGLTELSE